MNDLCFVHKICPVYIQLATWYYHPRGLSPFDITHHIEQTFIISSDLNKSTEYIFCPVCGYIVCIKDVFFFRCIDYSVAIVRHHLNPHHPRPIPARFTISNIIPLSIFIYGDKFATDARVIQNLIENINLKIPKKKICSHRFTFSYHILFLPCNERTVIYIINIIFVVRLYGLKNGQIGCTFRDQMLVT